MITPYERTVDRPTITHFAKGLGLTACIAVVAKGLGALPYLSMIGPLVIAIILGMVWRMVVGVNVALKPSIAFSSKQLLRLGIILLGMRLNLVDIYAAGSSVFLVALINLLFALVAVYGLTRLFRIEKKLSILLACGTAICGAAAVLAIAPQIKAEDDDTAVGAATVALLGTVFTILYTLLYPILPLSVQGYGIFAGGTLHEVAHVIAAATAGGESAVDMAVVVKLTRVALLVPVAIVISYIVSRDKQAVTGQPAAKKSVPWSIFPWFIIGFIAMSGFNALSILSTDTANHIVTIAYFLLGMAMAALGLNVELKAFQKFGLKPIQAGLIGSVLLAALGYIVVFLFHLNA